MARKPVSTPPEGAAPKSAPKPAAKSASKPVDPRKRAIDALMTLAAERPWGDIELPDIAAEAGLTLAQLRGFFPSKLAMLGGLTRLVDEVVLAETSDDLAGEPARERMFDLVMRRLDAMAPYKAGLRKIAPTIRRDPLALAALNRGAVNSWRYMLASAGIPTEDALGHLRVQGAVLLMARVSETWLGDDEPELSKTMARLDRELKLASCILARAEDMHRLTAPFRGLARAICSGRPLKARRRERAPERGEDNEDYAPAI